MMSKDGLDGGLRGRVLEGIEPRKGTETFRLRSSIWNDMVRRNRTPKGDGNKSYSFNCVVFHLLEGIEPRKGTETTLSF